MKRQDPVVALITAGGKQIKIPRLVIGCLEEMAANPEKRFGNNRAEIFRYMLCTARHFANERARQKKWDEQVAAAIAEGIAERGAAA